MTSKVANTEVAQPYAQALLSIAKSKSLTEEFGTDARTLLNLLAENQQLRNFIDNPFIAAENKKALIKQILSEASPYLRNFLLLLVDKRRIFFLEEILQQYLALLRQLNQTVLAEVTSAVALTEDQQQAVKEKVLALTKARQVELATKVDSDLIGGVIIKVGSQVIDSSIRGQLRRLSLRLSNS
ncbi:ATP synthase F1 subcomplex delta subunit [Trichormus variabilis ATCC 29413]|uniref:ATP synthase subunit delta n=3 Tax=Nostocaceae TaxID=1162 RepID=ATPD_TRIV2|nr:MULTISPECIES: ATP synthase F1 subunit delta [Nostocaceae]Q3M9V9.1 RecName: Full=ATP synthase subunit delta; AltName: Full=ATP synthase F(1) sector subunit delta; AltName: Full=F-type ATPase subunit delta; Short=F-ATPase subunit delta [Trichormus variabilis ATCC 29413]ABA22227.1 ATP synthase F1 subcomplex delta subunit [Trichormus variabilis ATCC 29413]MBC1214619.1 F0F1 ATP synthase subunit delta [Trichormus variabilis ARAD]MBC1254900.1 F0F1 ATP synthase subunit delta [Trichormus variabilis V